MCSSIMVRVCGTLSEEAPWKLSNFRAKMPIFDTRFVIRIKLKWHYKSGKYLWKRMIHRMYFFGVFVIVVTIEYIVYICTARLC